MKIKKNTCQNSILLQYALFLAGAFPKEFGHIIAYPRKITPEKLLNGRVVTKKFYMIVSADGMKANIVEIQKDPLTLRGYLEFVYVKPVERDGLTVVPMRQMFLGQPYDFFKGKPPIVDRIIIKLFFRGEAGKRRKIVIFSSIYY